MNRTEQFQAKQEAMSDKELIELVEKQIYELARTGGKSHRMCVPPMITDTDMLFCELVRRFKNSFKLKEALEELILVKEWKDKFGKDEYYLKSQPIAWENAKEAINKTTE